MTESGEPRVGPDGADARVDGSVLWLSSGIVASAYALGAMLQAAYVYAVVAPQWPQAGVAVRAVANLVAVATLLGMLVLWRQHRRHGARELVAGVVLAAAVTALVRAGCQLALGVYPEFSVPATPVEAVSGFVVGILSGGAGTWAMQVRRDLRAEARAAERSAIDRALAVRALEDEETRVRRDVAEGLHASVQQRLVLLSAQIGAVAERLSRREAGERDAAVLGEVRTELERIRAEDVRGMSRILYPDQIDVGLVPAVRALLRRVPSSIAAHLEVDAAARAADDPVSPALAATERLLAVRVVEEGIANALRHGTPTRLTVEILLEGRVLEVRVEDDGPGFDEAAIHPSGTLRLAERLAVAGGRLELTGRPGTGARLVGRLPVAGAAEPRLAPAAQKA